jgi:homoserine dehydrogenase
MKLSVGIGLLGCGTVGAAVAERLIQEQDAIQRRSGIAYELRAIGVRDPVKVRTSSAQARLITSDVMAILDDPNNDLIVECVGGTTGAAEFIEYALDRGRHVVTANKDLLATQGPRLQALAVARGASLRFEGAVAGAVPIIRVLDDALAGDLITSVSGVINGTSTLILSAMEKGESYAHALAEAQRLGYAEADPSSDVEGIDAAHKLAVLMQLAFRLAIISPRIRRVGIADVTRHHVGRASMLGLRIRLVASAVRIDNHAFADVAPVLVPETHAFAQASGPENVVRIVARDAGTLTFRGAGAGGQATASAVLGDIVTALRVIGERHDLSHRSSFNQRATSSDISSFFGRLPRISELSDYPVWDDSITNARQDEGLLREAVFSA